MSTFERAPMPLDSVCAGSARTYDVAAGLLGGGLGKPLSAKPFVPSALVLCIRTIGLSLLTLDGMTAMWRSLILWLTLLPTSSSIRPALPSHTTRPFLHFRPLHLPTSLHGPDRLSLLAYYPFRQRRPHPLLWV